MFRTAFATPELLGFTGDPARKGKSLAAALLLALPLAGCVQAPSTKPSQSEIVPGSLGLGDAPAPQKRQGRLRALVSSEPGRGSGSFSAVVAAQTHVLVVLKKEIDMTTQLSATQRAVLAHAAPAHADEALYKAKRSGRNAVRAY